MNDQLFTQDQTANVNIDVDNSKNQDHGANIFLSSRTSLKEDSLKYLLGAVLVGVALHGYFLYSGLFRGSYDAYVHIFFAQKYVQNNMNTWVYNWFDGFDMASYPPLVHQLVGSLSTKMGLENSYIVVQLVGVVLLITGVYRFASIWVDSMSASVSAFSAATLTSYAQAVHHFGQLPNTFAIGFALHAVSYFAKWILDSRYLSLFSSLAYLWVVLTSHHLSFFMFAPILFGVVSLTFLQAAHVNKQNPSYRLKVNQVLTKTVLYALLAGISSIVILYPFIAYVSHMLPQQIEIPHATRTNYFLNIETFVNFFAIPMATMAVFAVIGGYICKIDRSMRFLGLGVLFLAVLGLGGSTPIPKWILGKMWGVMTYDRYVGWASVCLTPFVGWIYMRSKSRLLLAVIFGFQLSIVLGYFFFLQKTKFQPDPLDFKEVASFLNEADHSSFKYLTLGVGCQLARLSTQTKAPTVDGLYFTARTPKVLRDSGIEAIDFVKYFGEKGEKVLLHYLKNPQTYYLKYILVNDAYFDPFLDKNGWTPVKRFSKTLQIWQTKANISPLDPSFFSKKTSLSPASQKLWRAYPLTILLVTVFELLALLGLVLKR